MRWPAERLLDAGILAFCLAAAAPAWVLWGPSSDRDSNFSTPADGIPPPPMLVEPKILPREYLMVAAQRNPFSSARLEPSVVATPTGEGQGSRPSRGVQLLGTMMLPQGGGLALVRTGPGDSRLIRPGETFGGLTLKNIRLGSATFVSPSGALIEMVVERVGG